MGKGLFIIYLLALIVLMFALSFTGVFNKLATITGFATTQTVSINITVSGANAPVVFVDNQSMTSISGGPNEGPTTTLLKINLTVYDADGNGDINDSNVRVNFTRSGETPRYNTTCQNTLDFSTYYANFTCQVTMYWYDGSGLWTINANASDATQRNSSNTTQNFFVGATDAFTAAPTALTWNSLTAGTGDQESNNDPILANNTGNVNKHLNVNSTHLRGETNPNLALWANNFSVHTAAGCGGTNMSYKSFTNITGNSFQKGNFTVNDGSTGQEQLYFCIEQVGSDLTAQSYSTANTSEGSWTVQIVTSN